MATIPAITGSDGFAPQYDPDARWCYWNLDEIYTGGPGLNRYVPKVNDWVIDRNTRSTLEVTAVDAFTLIPTLTPLSSIGVDGSELIGPGSDSYRVYLDVSVTPHVMAVDARLKIHGSMNSFAKIFRGTNVGNTGHVLSFLYDGNGQFLTNNIPLELAAIDNHTNTTIKSVSVCHTNEELSDGELVTIVIYNEQGHVVTKRALIVENTSFIRNIGAGTRYISHISVKSAFLSASDTHLLEYPLNVPLQAFNMIGVVHYSDGDTLELPVDGGKFKMLGLERFVSTVPGQEIQLALSYALETNEVCYGAVSADGKYVTEAFRLISVPQNGAFTVKLFGYPHWVDSTVGYVMKWMMMDLNRDILFDVTPYVYYNTNSDVFSPLSYNNIQNLSVRINLRDVSGAFKPYIHTQTIAVVLKEPGDALTTHWVVGFEPGQNPFYGNNLFAKTTMVNANLWKVNITSSFANQTDWLQALYHDSKPLMDRRTEIAAPTPTHFVIIKGASREEFPITQWSEDLFVGMPLGSTGTLMVEFIKRTTNNDLRLAVAGLPIIPVI